jgi:putative hemolysin
MDNSNSSELNIPEGTIIADTLLHIFNYNKLSELYSFLHDKDPVFVIDSIFRVLDLKYNIPQEDLKNIPLDGAFITVSNHPFRGIDSMILYKIISEKRIDFKILASYLLHQIEPLREIVIPVNTHETTFDKSSYTGIKQAINHLECGNSIGIFPTGEADTPIESSRVVLDNIWQPAAVKFLKNSQVPLVPVYFHGTNSRFIHIMGKIHPILRQTKLPSEIRRRSNKTISVRIGSPITVKDQGEFEDLSHFGRYLRARVYSLGSTLEVRKFSFKRPGTRILKAVPVAEQSPVNILKEEFDRIRPDFELFSSKNYSVVCAPAEKIPAIFIEIGRLRELTFRKVGEGTNKSTDIDEYDFYFNHLFIWDTEASRIVGAYRIGKGQEIISGYGINGFYINSLFRLKRSFQPVLLQSLELGRSFVAEEYQKKTIPLFLLWKGIMVFLLRNPEYRYLIGPVSISNDFSKFSKSLIVEFVRKYFTDETYAGYVVPRKDFIVKPDKAIDRNIFIDTSESDINKIEKIIIDIEPGYRLPVLLKKYLEINGRIIGFNIDPEFNYCLDGLLILDLYNIPGEFIQGLSRQLNDESILERFREPARLTLNPSPGGSGT